MVEFLRDIGRFVWAVLSHWQAYMTGGIIMAALTIYERLTEQTVSLRVVVGGILAFLLVAFFMAWRDQRKAALAANRTVEELKSEVADLKRKVDDANRALIYNKEQDKPKFIGSVGQVATAHYDVLDCPIVFVAFEVRNTGAPSAADTWSLTLKGKDIDRTFRPGYLTGNQKVSGESLTGEIKPEDLIYDRARQPIPRNGSVSGWLIFVLEGEKMGITNVPGTKLTVSFRDALENEYSVNGEFTEKPGQLMYMPGTRPVFQPKKGKTGGKPNRRRKP